MNINYSSDPDSLLQGTDDKENDNLFMEESMGEVFLSQFSPLAHMSKSDTCLWFAATVFNSKSVKK